MISYAALRFVPHWRNRSFLEGKQIGNHHTSAPRVLLRRADGFLPSWLV